MRVRQGRATPFPRNQAASPAVSSRMSSAKPAAINAAPTRGPPSLNTRVIPRDASVARAAARSRRPKPSRATVTIATPASAKADARADGTPVPVITRVGTSRAVCTRRDFGDRARLLSSTTRSGLRSTPGRRTVARGSSVRAVPLPIITASCKARCICVKALADAPVSGEAGVVRRPGGEAVGRLRELQRDGGAPGRHAQNMADVRIPRGFGKRADGHVDPRRTQLRMATAGNARIRIFERRHHAGDPGSDDRFGARRRPPVVTAGFERDVEGCALRQRTGLRQRFRFGVGTAAGLRCAGADHDAVAHHQGHRRPDWALRRRDDGATGRARRP